MQRRRRLGRDQFGQAFTKVFQGPGITPFQKTLVSGHAGLVDQASLAEELVAIRQRGVGLQVAAAIGVEGKAELVSRLLVALGQALPQLLPVDARGRLAGEGLDRNSTRLNSSHLKSSYDDFC